MQLHGDVLPADITSTSNQLFVRFESDFSMVDEGFSFTYEDHCANVIPCAADIVLVLDLSSSIPQDQFELAREFMMAFVDCEVLQEKDVRIAVVNYTCEAHTYFSLTPITMGMSHEIEHLMRGDGGITCTGRAIYYMRRTSKFRAAPEAHHTAVILTDGQSDDHQQAEAADARNAGIDLYAVGFGYPVLVDWAALATMTGDPVGSRVFDTSQACDAAQKIVADQCGE
ncbi:matrilin-3-like [Branchiostoma floridae]|uniref:Matrilin-3-like n=1 Tax=Branchiostoma floridae TaxID=7739 RepID=A0A9J7HGV2_BRAFL|nr:matrilin-3-like [Branchiostoma floridae]